MVLSNIDTEISYPEFKAIDDIDNGIDASVYDTTIKNIDVVIALGKLRNDFKDKGIYYIPIYIVINDTISDKIGIYEIAIDQYTTILDEDGDIDIDSLEPLIFNFVTPEYLNTKYSDHPITYESSNNENENENKDNDEDNDDGNNGNEDDSKKSTNGKSNMNDVNNSTNPELYSRTMNRETPGNFMTGRTREILKEIVIEEDDDENKVDIDREEHDETMKRRFVKKRGTHSSWIENYMKNNEYGIQDNEGGGDCFFAIVRDAFKSIGVNITVKQLREVVSENAVEKDFNEYKNMYDSILSSIEESKAQLLQMMREWKEMKTRIEQERDGKNRLLLISNAKKFKAKFDTIKRDKAMSQRLLGEYRWLRGINSFDDFKQKIKTCQFWADSDTIVIIEQILKIKIIIMSSYNYLQGDLGAVLQCVIWCQKL